jgi:twitching motility protein PilT
VELNAVLRRAVEQGASDVHLKVDQFPVIRCDGTLVPFTDHPPLTNPDLEAALAIVSELAPARREAFYETGELDIAYTSGDLPRFRVNAFRQRGSISFAFRVIPDAARRQGDGRRAPRPRARHRRHRLR